MLTELLHYFSGLSLFEHRLFRAGAASLFAFTLVFFLMPKFIRALTALDATSDFGGAGKKAPPPICGGLLVVSIVMLSSVLFTTLNSYVISILMILGAYTLIGGIDDLVKIKTKRQIKAGKQTAKSYQDKADGISSGVRLSLYFLFSFITAIVAYKFIPHLTSQLTIPFFKPEVWFPKLPNWAFIILICFVTTSTANGANFTDGLDSLVTVPFITTCLFVGGVAYISGNSIFSEYLLLPHLPGVDELLPVTAAIIGALLAYLWYNSPPAQIYMGDGGSIGLGGAIGMMFVLVKAELFLPIVGIVFVSEALSVVIQISWFKLTRKFRKDKTGQRIFLRAPLHHHFQIKLKDQFGPSELVNSKVVWRFHIVSAIALIVGYLLFFKVR